jgi:hypothetical protein
MTRVTSLIILLVALLAATVMALGAGDARAAGGQCINAPKVTKFLSKKGVAPSPPGSLPHFGFGLPIDAWLNLATEDHTFAQLDWSPRFCRNGKGWTVDGEPKLNEVGAGGAAGIGLNLTTPTPHSIGVTYFGGKVRGCPPLSAGYAGVSYGGKLCATMANGFIGVYINAKKQIFYRFPNLKPTFLGRALGSQWVWTNNVI